MPSQVADAGIEGTGAGDILLKPTGDDLVINLANGDGTASKMLEDESPEGGVLETVSERRARYRSHYVVYITTFVMSIGFSIVITGVWPYLQRLDTGVSKEFLGWVIAANPLGQMLASPLLGLWSNKAGSNRGAFFLTVFVFIIGNALYAILSLFGSAARAVMVFSRFLVGISSANIAIIRSYVAASTTVKERTFAVSLTSAAQGLGFIIGPAIQAAIAVGFAKEREYAANSTLTESLEYDLDEEAEPRVEWNMYTAAGWFAVILGAVNFLLFLPCVFQEHTIAAKEAQHQRQADNVGDDELPKPDYAALVSVLFSFFVILFMYVLLETLVVPMCMDLYAWSDEMAIKVVGVGLSVAGLVVTIMFALVGFLTRKFDERKVYMFLGLVPLLISMVCFFPMGSTYPKMQNCTSEAITTSLPNHLEDVMATTLPLDYTTKFGDSLARQPNEIDKASDSLILETGSSHSSTENPINPFIENRNYSDNSTVPRRSRRHVVRDEKCRDLGCPSDQEWCLYTPIIELSQLGIASFVVTVGYPVAFALSSSFFSKLLGPKPQGVWMGILTSTGSFSRVAGPITVSYLYTELGTRWTFSILFVTIAITIVLMSIFFKRLVPMKIARG